MRVFSDEASREWVATAHEEATPRHHGRWFLVFHPAETVEPVLPLAEVRWQTRETAERTLLTMSMAELLRRLHIARQRAGEVPRSAAPSV